MYFEKAIDRNGAPDTVTMDKSGANLAALQAINSEGFKDFGCARIILSGIETMHMISKGQMKDDGVSRTAAAQFYSLMI